MHIREASLENGESYPIPEFDLKPNKSLTEASIKLTEKVDESLSFNKDSFKSLDFSIDSFSSKHITGNQNFDHNDTKIHIPRADMPLAKASLFLFGVTGVLNWSVILNAIFSVFSTIYNFETGADTILIPYFFLSLTVGLVRLKYRSMSTVYFYTGLGILIFTNISMAMSIFFFEGITGIISIHVISAFTGLGVSLVLANGFAYASILPINLTSYSVAGNGFAGFLGFLIWQFLTQLFFDVNIIIETQYAVIGVFSVCLLTVFIALILFLNMHKKPWFIQSLRRYEESVKIDITHEQLLAHKASNSSVELKGVRPLSRIVKDAKMSLIMGNGAFFLTYSIFPNVGPYAWYVPSLNLISVLVGIYQGIDSLARYLPNISLKFMMPYKILVYASAARLLFYPIYFSFAIFETPFTKNFGIQALIMFLLGFTHGITSSQALARVPAAVQTFAERGIAGICMNIFMQLGLALAITFSATIKYFFGI